MSAQTIFVQFEPYANSDNYVKVSGIDFLDPALSLHASPYQVATAQWNSETARTLTQVDATNEPDAVHGTIPASDITSAAAGTLTLNLTVRDSAGNDHVLKIVKTITPKTAP